jgi:hypothetical protein
MTDSSIFDNLREPFNTSCIEWLPKKVLPPRNPDRNGKGVGRALALCYIDARSVMARLDEVVGPQNWQDAYRVEGARTICRLSIRIEMEAGSGNFVWVGKEDGSGDTAFEAEKGGISGAFKRAAVKWGIGRYLYDVPEVWADCNVTVRESRGKPQVYHNGWTEEGERDLARALASWDGFRETGTPPTVAELLDAIDKAETVPDLKRLYDKHWPDVPLDYRAEVLRNLDRRRDEIEDATGGDRGDDGDER